tara:strand:+ start:217 stop:528 length:312 start_codon:yes stop_codon:yes gene_type:complete
MSGSDPEIRDRAGHTVKGIDPVSHARGRVIRMQENQIKVGDLVICEDTLFVTKEEQRAGIVLSVWCEVDKYDTSDDEYEMCTVQHPGFRSLWQTQFLKVLARA